MKNSLKKYAQENDQILAMFYIEDRNKTKAFTEVYTVVSEVIVSKMQEDLEGLFHDVILTNKRKDSFKLEKRWQNYTILEIFRKKGMKLSESIISSDFAKDFIKGLPDDLVFIYDKIDLEEKVKDEDFSYDLPKDYQFDQTSRRFFALALETSFLLVERNSLAASMKMQEVRKELFTLVDWYIRDRFSGKKSAGKDFENVTYSVEEEYRFLAEESFSNADYMEIYDALFKACSLFRKLGLVLSEKFDFTYLKKEDAECLKILRSNYKEIEKLIL